MLGRKLKQAPHNRGEDHPLQELESEAIPLTVQPEDLAGVFGRLARRVKRLACSLLRTNDVLKTWEQNFGGDFAGLQYRRQAAPPSLVARQLGNCRRLTWPIMCGANTWSPETSTNAMHCCGCGLW